MFGQNCHLHKNLSYIMSATFSTGVRVVAKPAQRASAARAPVAVVANLQKVRAWGRRADWQRAAWAGGGKRGSRTRNVCANRGHSTQKQYRNLGGQPDPHLRTGSPGGASALHRASLARAGRPA